MSNDVTILKLSLKKITSAFDSFISECIDEHGNPITPSKGSLMKAKAYLPSTCTNAFKKKQGND